MVSTASSGNGALHMIPYDFPLLYFKGRRMHGAYRVGANRKLESSVHFD
jgi:hypothetical protein